MHDTGIMTIVCARRLFKDAEHERTTEQTSFTLEQLDKLVPNLHLPQVLRELAGTAAPLLEHTPVLVRYARTSPLLLQMPSDTNASYILH